MLKDHTYWIEALKLEKHREGGYWSSTYESPHKIKGSSIDQSFKGTRSLSTSIYFLIHDEDVSNFHRLKADEIWYYHGGEPLIVAVIDEKGKFNEYKLGINLSNGEQPQLLVPAGCIFGSYVINNRGFSLVGCMVSYGFDFEDFELFKRSELINKYPQHNKIITKLTRN